jgi:hypothetical protein
MASREEIQERIHIEQAWVDGKDVQIKNDYTWLPIGKDDALFLFDKCQYRIKPEPKDIFANEYKDGSIGIFYSKDEAEFEADGCEHVLSRAAIHYREVTDE